MKNKIYLLTFIFLYSCAAPVRGPQTFEDKMADINNSQSVNAKRYAAGVYPVQFNSLNRVTRSRGPASTKKKEGQLTMSNKRLYFVTLYSQYQKLKQFSPLKHPGIKICPSFHTGLVNLKKGQLKKGLKKVKFSFATAKSSNKKTLLALYPELGLPVSQNNNRPIVWDMIHKDKEVKSTILALKEGPNPKKIINKAVQIHLLKMHQELTDLCENGVSDNYYKFENLITYIKGHLPFGPSEKNMEILMKISLFSNKAIIDSLEEQSITRSRFPASNLKDPYLGAVMKRLNSKWAKEYYRTILDIRKSVQTN